MKIKNVVVTLIEDEQGNIDESHSTLKMDITSTVLWFLDFFSQTDTILEKENINGWYTNAIDKTILGDFNNRTEERFTSNDFYVSNIGNLMPTLDLLNLLQKKYSQLHSPEILQEMKETMPLSYRETKTATYPFVVWSNLLSLDTKNERQWHVFKTDLLYSSAENFSKFIEYHNKAKG